MSLSEEEKLKLLEGLQPYLLDIDSSKGQELIMSSDKVEELWWDSEITNTKARSLYGRRSHLHISTTFLEDREVLWDKKEGRLKLITDFDRVYEIIKKYVPDFYSLYYESLKQLTQALQNAK